MNEQQMLECAICDNPNEDTLRLAYADCLDENARTVLCSKCNGDTWHRLIIENQLYVNKVDGTCSACTGFGYVSDGRKERAELIRVQIALSRMSPEHKQIGFSFSGAETLRSIGPDYWQFNNCEPGDIMAGDRLDVKRYLLSKKRIGRREQILYGLLVIRIEIKYDGFDFDGPLYTVKRDENSKPWAGRSLKNRELELLTLINSAELSVTNSQEG